jgi:hypothetical protein
VGTWTLGQFRMSGVVAKSRNQAKETGSGCGACLWKRTKNRNLEIIFAGPIHISDNQFTPPSKTKFFVAKVIRQYLLLAPSFCIYSIVLPSISPFSVYLPFSSLILLIKVNILDLLLTLLLLPLVTKYI